MRIVIAPDSFKECLTATQVSLAISDGILRIFPEAEIICIPMADGGEGTVESLVAATCGQIIPASSLDALNRPIQSFYGVLGDGITAVIEMAAASGIELLSAEERNPMITSTFGTGLLIKAAMEAGYAHIILGIGGSATNDGGAGMAQALGYGLLDINNHQIGPGGGSLGKLDRIDHSNVHPLLQKVKITVASDVRNLLLGPSGATYVYGPQKGASPEMLEILENNLTHFSGVLEKEFGENFDNTSSAGAAGGLGAGLMAFCRAEIVSGFDMINELTHLEEQISQSALVFTGEGKIDSQSAYGKTVGGVARIAKKHGIQVIALAGVVASDLTEIYQLGVSSVFAIADRPMSPEESKERAGELLASSSERIMRLILDFKSK